MAGLPPGFVKDTPTQNGLPPGFVKDARVPVGRQGDNAGPVNAFAYGVTGGQVPFGNVISSGIGAAYAKGSDLLRKDKLFEDQSLGDLYNQAQADTRATQEANPGLTTAGNIVGALSTLPAAFTKPLAGATGARGIINNAPTQIGNFVGSSTLKASPGAGLATRTTKGAVNAAVRGVKGAAVAAPTAFAYGAGDAEPGRRFEAGSDSARIAAYTSGGIALGLPVAGAALGLVAPKIDEGLKDVAILAKKYGIPLSFDQISSSRALKNAQKVSQELPFSGQEKFRDSQLRAWNKGILKTVGLDADKFTKINMDKAFTQVGHEFDTLAKGKTFQFDDAFSRRLDDIRQEAMSTSNRDAIANFEDAVSKALKEAGPLGEISGEKLGKLRSSINRLARKASNIDTQSLLHDLENAVIDVMTEGDDLAKSAFSLTKQKYKNLLAIEPLASKAKAGNISPSQLNNRVSQIYGRAHTRGKAGEIGDLAQIGFELLPELGGSDTTQKALYTAGVVAALGGGGIANPAVGLPAIALSSAGMAANRGVQAGLNRNQKLIDRALSLDDVLKLAPNEAKKLSARNIAKTK